MIHPQSTRQRQFTSFVTPIHAAQPILHRVNVLVFSGCNSNAATVLLQPVAFGAAAEVARSSEPSRRMCDFGDATSSQAITKMSER